MAMCFDDDRIATIARQRRLMLYLERMRYQFVIQIYAIDHNMIFFLLTSQYKKRLPPWS